MAKQVEVLSTILHLDGIAAENCSPYARQALWETVGGFSVYGLIMPLVNGYGRPKQRQWGDRPGDTDQLNRERRANLLSIALKVVGPEWLDNELDRIRVRNTTPESLQRQAQDALDQGDAMLRERLAELSDGEKKAVATRNSMVAADRIEYVEANWDDITAMVKGTISWFGMPDEIQLEAATAQSLLGQIESRFSTMKTNSLAAGLRTKQVDRKVQQALLHDACKGITEALRPILRQLAKQEASEPMGEEIGLATMETDRVAQMYAEFEEVQGRTSELTDKPAAK